MLRRENYTSEHILRLGEETGADPSILERTVYAFGLLEAIRSVEMPFIFKGGTSLLVLLDEPRRLSTDIDIIVDRGTDIDAYIEKAGKIFPFGSCTPSKYGLKPSYFSDFVTSKFLVKATIGINRHKKSGPAKETAPLFWIVKSWVEEPDFTRKPHRRHLIWPGMVCVCRHPSSPHHPYGLRSA